MKKIIKKSAALIKATNDKNLSEKEKQIRKEDYLR
jgi:hypothetical protein